MPRRQPSKTWIDPSTLLVLLDLTRRERGLSWRGVAKETGLSPSTFTRLSAGRLPDANGFAAMVVWSGFPFGRFLQGVTEVGRAPDPVAEAALCFRRAGGLSESGYRHFEKVLSAMYAGLRGIHGTG